MNDLTLKQKQTLVTLAGTLRTDEYVVLRQIGLGMAKVAHRWGLRQISDLTKDVVDGEVEVDVLIDACSALEVA